MSEVSKTPGFDFDQNNTDKKLDQQIAVLLRSQVQPAHKNTNNSEKDDNEKKESNSAIIKNVNNKFLIDVISPQVEQNEIKKRKHKDLLMRFMGIFLLSQFILVAIMIIYIGYWIVQLHIKGMPFPDSTLKIIFTFMGTYITSVIVELIAILRYIVKNVFDTSITGMAKIFKDKKK